MISGTSSVIKRQPSERHFKERTLGRMKQNFPADSLFDIRDLCMSYTRRLEMTRKYCAHLFKYVQHAITTEGNTAGGHRIRVTLAVVDGMLHLNSHSAFTNFRAGSTTYLRLCLSMCEYM